MYLKTTVVLTITIGAYVVLVFQSSTPWMAIAAGFILAQGIALVGFNIMHDGGHDSYANHKKLNWLASFSLDLVGGNRAYWRYKHNILHHTYTNIDELDNDLHPTHLLRLSPNQEWREIHRYQHLYAFALYSLLTLSWTLRGDFKKFFTRRIDNYRLPDTTHGERFVFLFTKLFYFGYALILPSFYHPLSYVLIAFLGVHLVSGFTLSLIVQLGHQTEGTTFPQPNSSTGIIENDWAIHEVETSTNFASTNKLATWYFGGMNYHIEHHLFPRVCHVHYPVVSDIVEKTCKEYGIPYRSRPTVRSAVAAHYRFLKVMGSRTV